MNKIVVAKMGVEGGGATIFARQVDGAWSFWQEGSSMYLDENDDEGWHSWSSEPVADLTGALPEQWWMMFPSEVHPEFVEPLRREYERCRGTESDSDTQRHRHMRWVAVLAGGKT